MTWQQRTSKIEVGCRVCYAKRFLQSTGQLTGDIPAARGTVKEIKEYGSLVLAVIDWGNPDIPEKVAVANLSRVTEKGIMERE